MTSRRSPKSSGTAAGTDPVDSGESEIDFHRGQALLSFCTRYPSLMKTLLEMIQNGIDNEASAIFVGVDLDRRQVIVADNGVGTTLDKFEEALRSVAKSVKRPGKLGRFGIGLVSPIDKCDTYAFSSVPAGQKHGLTWTFREEDIQDQHDKLVIPRKPTPNLPKVGGKFAEYQTGPFKTQYRTHIKLSGVTRDKQISLVDIDAFESEIHQNFGTAMLKYGVHVRVVLINEGEQSVRDIDPEPFKGEPFEVITYRDSAAGQVEIELYRAPRQRGQRSGKTTVMMFDDDFGVPMSAFARQARFASLNEKGEVTVWDFVRDAVTVLDSGFFEGNIKCQHIELNADRTSFVYNDALHGLYVVLSNWYDEHGQKLYEAEREEDDRNRYERLGAASLEKLKELLQNSLWKKFGRPTPEPDGTEEAEETTDDEGGEKPGTRGGDGTGGGGEPRGGSGEGKHPTKPRPGGSGDSGDKSRASVHGASQGLSFSYDELPGNMRLWEFDFQTGTLILNIRHPVWVKLDETKGKHTARNDKWIMHLQEWLALELLNLLVSYSSAEDLEANRELIDRRIDPYVEIFILGKR